MAQPLLALDHDWHRQRATLRHGRLRPPPLVAAGIDISFAEDTRRGVKLGGLAVIFGTFPPTLDEFAALARARLHLGPDQARELDPVLNTRILAMWAWLPTRRQDCYLEYDRATDDLHLWVMGPGPGDAIELGEDDPRLTGEIDAAFLDALVLNGSNHWGGESGLERLVERFGHQPLLIAARIADHLEHQPREPRAALEIAQGLWRDLDAEDESPWADLAGTEHPWTCVQLGRLALRLGLLRAARLLLSSSGGTEIAPIALFDLGQACEALDDLPAAESAFSRFAAARPNDPDAWRRLLFCRLRMGNLSVAEETLKRYRGCGGKDDELVERFLTVVARSRLRLAQRALVAGWLGMRVDAAIRARHGLGALAEEIARLRFAPGRVLGESAAPFLALVTRARQELTDQLATRGPNPPTAAHDADGLLRTVLVAAPLLGLLHRSEHQLTAQDIAERLLPAMNLWCDLRLPGGMAFPTAPEWLVELARLARGLKR